MEPVYKSRAFSLYHDQGGFVEFVVNEGHELNKEDFPSIEDILGLPENQIPPLKVLVNRKHDYSTGPSLLIPPFPALDIRIGRLAYLVYSSRTAKIAQYVGNLALPHAPHRIFHDRDTAISWLLKG